MARVNPQKMQGSPVTAPHEIWNGSQLLAAIGSTVRSNHSMMRIPQIPKYRPSRCWRDIDEDIFKQVARAVVRTENGPAASQAAEEFVDSGLAEGAVNQEVAQTLVALRRAAEKPVPQLAPPPRRPSQVRTAVRRV